MKSYDFNIKRLPTIVILSIILFISSFENVVLAEQNNNIGGKSYIKNEVINDDITFKGVFTSHSIYFNIDKWWSIENVDIEINLSVNQLVDVTKDSYITFNINGVPFYSSKLVYNPKQEVQNIKAKVPIDNLKEGFNEFKIDGYCRITDKPCTDDINTANWMIIKKNSKLNINYKEKITDNIIKNFPYPFVKNNTSQITQIVLSDDYTDMDLKNALLLSSYLGKNDTNTKYKSEIIKYSDLIKQKNNNNIIFIGSKNSIPNEISSAFKDISTIDLSNNSIIKLGNSPYKGDFEEVKVMLICSENDSLNLKAIKFLMNSELTTQVNNDTFIISENINEEIKVEEVNKLITFESMGISEMQFKGPFRRTGTVSYLIPKNRIVAEGTNIKLNFRYSDNLNFNKSLITVYINNIAIGSKKLEKENALADTLELSIPSNIIKNNYIEIKLAFDLELIDSYCEMRQEETPWALIDGSSYIYSETQNSLGYFFEKYPAPFALDNRFNDVLISVPDSLSSKELTSLGKCFSVIGKEINGNVGEIDVSRYSNLNGREKNKNLIVYGTPSTNTLIKDLNKKLWFKYDDNYNYFIGNEKLYLTEPFNSNISMFQLDLSPYNTQKAMLVLTAPNNDILLNSLSYLESSNEVNKLTGDSIIIDEYGDIRKFRFKEEDKKPVYEKIIGLDKSSRGILIIVALIFIFLLASTIMYLIKNKKRKFK